MANGEDLDRDPQLRARGYWARLPTKLEDGRTDVVLDGPPFTLSRTPGYVAAPGPLLGEQTDDVLRRVLGLSAQQVAVLQADRVVASHADIAAERQPGNSQ